MADALIKRYSAAATKTGATTAPSQRDRAVHDTDLAAAIVGVFALMH